MKFKYSLKNKNSEEETSVLLTFHYNGKRFRYFPGIKLLKKHWNEKNQNLYSTGKQATQWNKKLKEIKNELETEYYKQIEGGSIPEPGYFKKHLDKKFKAKNEYEGSDFYSLYDEFMLAKEKYVEPSTFKKYKALLNHLKDIEKHFKISFNPGSFTKEFYYEFVDYFIDVHGHRNSTVKEKHLSTIKTFLNWSVEKGHIKKNEFRNIKFPYKINPADTISLNAEELDRVHNFDLTNNKRLEQVRDIFCLECYTGLRYSDAAKVKKENYTGRFLKIHTDKTIQNLSIPLRLEAVEILDKYYDLDLPLPIISNQKMNDYLKEIGELCEINTPISILKLSGIKKEEIIKKKFELITTHTGRRTFVTQSYERKMLPLKIMKITGHKSYDTFMKYYRLEDIDVSQDFFESWDNIKPRYKTSHIIKNLLTHKVDISVVALSFGIEVDEIEKLKID